MEDAEKEQKERIDKPKVTVAVRSRASVKSTQSKKGGNSSKAQKAKVRVNKDG